MIPACAANKHPEIRADGYEDATFLGRHVVQSGVAGIRNLFAGLPHITPLLPKPIRKTPAGTTVDQEFHDVQTLTASSRSFATTACA